MSTAAAFWIDHDYDREHASDGVSRYGAYVRDAVFEPWTDDDRAVELAKFAWRRATGPVLSPGYVRRHPRIAMARLERSGWDGSLLAMVDLVVGQPEPLRYLPAGDEPAMWQDWPAEFSFRTGHDEWFEPGGEELARSPYLLCQASLRFTVPQTGLARPPARPNMPLLVAQCRDTVAALVRALNTIVSPVIARIDTDRSDR
jgi:hypothetical protein